MKTIFLLDDSRDFLSMMKIFVQARCGCGVFTATSYESTVGNEDSVLKSDMAFLDINLGPEKQTGVDVYHWLRGHGYRRPIYFLTGHAKMSPEVQQAEALGDVVVLTKPIPSQDLKGLIGSLQ